MTYLKLSFCWPGLEGRRARRKRKGEREASKAGTDSEVFVVKGREVEGRGRVAEYLYPQEDGTVRRRAQTTLLARS